MTYDEAIIATVTRAEALHEVANHSANVAEFFADCGDRPEYRGADVLAWLGY